MTWDPLTVIAVVSVVSSTVIALATILANFLSGERQRRHERRLAVEERTWEAFSAAIYRVIGGARSVLDALDDVSGGGNESIALAGLAERNARFFDMVGEVLPMVEAHGADATRDRLISLRGEVRWLRVSEEQVEAARASQTAKWRAIEEGKFEDAAEIRHKQQGEAEGLRIVHKPELEEQFVQLIDAARSSISNERSPKRGPRTAGILGSVITDREDRVIGVLAVGIAVAFAVAGALFAPTAQTRWF